MTHTNVAAREDRAVIAGFRISAAAFGLSAAVLLGRGEGAQSWGLLALAAATVAALVGVINDLPLAAPALARWHLGFLWAWVAVVAALLPVAGTVGTGALIVASICTNIAWLVAAAANGWGPLIDQA